MTRPTTVVIGAGIVGLSTAYALLKRGCAVTVVEQESIPSPVASSTDHHRLIRRVYGDEEGYCARMDEAFASWRTMFADLGGGSTRYYSPCGVLAVSRRRGDYADRSRSVMQQLDVPFETFRGAAIEGRFPFLKAKDAAYATLSEGGALWASEILLALAAWLRAHGATVREFCKVLRVNHRSGTVYLASGEELVGERVVIAAGVRSGELSGAIGKCLSPRRSLVLYADPPAEMAAAWDNAPCWADLGGDTDLWGVPPLRGVPVKLGNAALVRRASNDRDQAVAPDEVHAILRSYENMVRGLDRFAVHLAVANYWTLAPDSRFVLADLGRSVLVSACSGHGFKFGALTGEDVAQFLTGERSLRRVATALAGRRFSEDHDTRTAPDPWVNL